MRGDAIAMPALSIQIRVCFRYTGCGSQLGSAEHAQRQQSLENQTVLLRSIFSLCYLAHAVFTACSCLCGDVGMCATLLPAWHSCRASTECA